jgi:predicted regulator of Ras-like GTPase activity (Roadblock/LC7/MglB family)
MANNPREDDIPAARPMSKDDKQIRDAQLQFYAGDVKKLNALLDAFLKKSNAKVAMLITQGGHMVTKVGLTDKMDSDTVAALVSGAFAATKLLFRSFNENDFALTVQKGKKEAIYIGIVGGRSLLTINFDDTTTQGAVQLYAAETTKKLEELYAAIDRGEGSGPGADEKIDDNFGANAGGALDNAFG